MRYHDSRDQSAELLRMVLPLMSRHEAAFNPLSYAVWYEYASGTNLSLKAAVDERVADGRRLNDADIQEFFDRFVALRDIESSMRVRADLQKVVERVAEATTQASESVGRYNEGLSNYQERLLSDAVQAAAVAEVVTGLLDETRQVLVKTGDLHENLVQNSREALRLQEALETSGRQALQDPLTGLLNLRGLQQRLREQFAGGMPGGSLLRLDVDRFGELSSTYGNIIGDRVLGAAAQALQAQLGADAIIARVSGEQYAALLPGMTPTALAERAERVRISIERGRVRRADSEDAVANLSASLGLTELVPGETYAVAQLRAERALERARGEGGNRILAG
jgi:diguanylate cyclase